MDIQRRDEFYAEIVKFEEAGQWDKLLDACIRIAELDLPDLEKSLAWINAAKAYVHLKNIEGALGCHDKAIQIEKLHNRFFAIELKAALLCEANRPEESLALYKELSTRKDLFANELQRFQHNVSVLEDTVKNKK